MALVSYWALVGDSRAEGIPRLPRDQLRCLVFTTTTEEKLFERSRRHHTGLQISEQADSVRKSKDFTARMIPAFHPDL